MSVPNTSQNRTSKSYSAEETVKFVAPRILKIDLKRLAHERNISVSALMRLIASEYIKQHRTV